VNHLSSYTEWKSPCFQRQHAAVPTAKPEAKLNLPGTAAFLTARPKRVLAHRMRNVSSPHCSTAGQIHGQQGDAGLLKVLRHPTRRKPFPQRLIYSDLLQPENRGRPRRTLLQRRRITELAVKDYRDKTEKSPGAGQR